MHPQSIVHSMVECRRRLDDRLPGQSARHAVAHLAGAGLAWSAYRTSVFPGLDGCQHLDLRAARSRGLPRAVALAKQVGKAGATYPAVFNAANEEAVAAFHAGRIGYLGILDTVQSVIDVHDPLLLTLEGVLVAEAWARAEAGAGSTASRPLAVLSRPSSRRFRFSFPPFPFPLFPVLPLPGSTAGVFSSTRSAAARGPGGGSEPEPATFSSRGVPTASASIDRRDHRDHHDFGAAGAASAECPDPACRCSCAPSRPAVASLGGTRRSVGAAGSLPAGTRRSTIGRGARRAAAARPLQPMRSCGHLLAPWSWRPAAHRPIRAPSALERMRVTRQANDQRTPRPCPGMPVSR